MSIKKLFPIFLLGLAVLVGFDSSALAVGQPEPWQLGLQEPVSPVAVEGHEFFILLTWLMTIITVIVLLLLLYVLFRFSAKRNPVPSKTTHHTLLEVVWTVVPVLILLVIAIPSFRLLYFADRVEDADLTLKIIGKQWYWTYEYPDNGNFTFDSLMIDEETAVAEGKNRLLDVDNPVVLPVDQNIRLIMTSDDVIHNWAMPSLFIKLDAVPGRLNETWTRIPAEYAGTTFYGQCSELCGVNHAYMPIAVKAVTMEEYEAWVAKAQEQFASADLPSSVSVASAE
ncbi:MULTISPECIES: cytochrome c oxidase subunit II [Thalassospira]|uniref:Cytochrome c oxidase subunit 2 n=1 Tax=Thalassospira povalilytica TaxID=732237 RepID=A0A8I1SI47_9PROT|nr:MULTISPECIES: cytochrome c oxidase subunit II [Thalassospira]RCK26617.1 cytochrome C oxidase subunit II [Thalassospira profundimaris]MAL40001.1 cytochrome c oxidase subunit II [Thalassospira sp.]MBN8195773.1 cytochrome c oxidase subunit II [Thalassospira povalilytica]MBO6769886.1 cytochrome c oxidase subunit II [Thalassospira sp.]MCC4239420.1 cytochrome c oxidase subunit II [Thalassospira povalilytica]|tara:strand:- start:390 stop:1238 length:849 start_codon:yes stop_codon:yes gene_type:complete|eukprot:TRINITY_DN1041_c0_g2_i14.p1 TRINITY_DN1041_c0_g2~~TRINITY_DN1041_c0_g2_i14.p1  ORF type:complete len:283 (+),score=33.76 TRINITY_DN1041_c0_g2_i14:448-1296(+)